MTRLEMAAKAHWAGNWDVTPQSVQRELVLEMRAAIEKLLEIESAETPMNQSSPACAYLRGLLEERE